MRRLLLLILFLIGLLLIFYLSWIPHPHIGRTGIVPAWLAEWADADENDTIRTGVPFIFLGLFAGIWIIINKKSNLWWLTSWMGLFITVLMAEVGQIFIENRVFDLMDVIWGAFGAFLGLVSAYGFSFLSRTNSVIN